MLFDIFLRRRKKTIVYAHVSSGGRNITLKGNKLRWKNTISPGVAPMYTNVPKDFFAEKKELYRQTKKKKSYWRWKR